MAAIMHNEKKWGFAIFLALPVFYLYTAHFLNHDEGSTSTGFMQWEHLLYMCSAKEYVTGNAIVLYEWPILNDFSSGTVFFQPQIFVLGYLWKFTHMSPGIVMMIFGWVFALLTLKVVISIIEKIFPYGKYNKLITMLFCWGGGILSFCGIVLHFIFFKGSFNNISTNIFFLDPANGSWCLNFGRALIFPLEAYYHFLFVSCIWFVLQRNFLKTFLVMLLLIISHPYTAIEIISIILVWVTIEYFYLKHTAIRKIDFIYILMAFILYFVYYGLVLNSINIYKEINKLNALDWGYKAWHFIPAYALVWALAFFCIRSPALLKKHFAGADNRLFFWWGTVAFLLSVHGFAIKPVQPIHFARGYVYAGFFLFSLPALQMLAVKYTRKKMKGYILLTALIFIFLFDNLSWFFVSSSDSNGPGVYVTKEENEVIEFFKQTKDQGIVIGNEKNYELNAAIQLYSEKKGWIPHPFLTFKIEEKRKAVDSLFTKGKLDESWKSKKVHLYYNKNDSTLQPYHFNFKREFENKEYIIFKLN